jgi:hypothetical protein
LVEENPVPSDSFRASAPFERVLAELGPLQELPGTWVGTGFSLISRPDFQNGQPFFLELNSTMENLTFTQIGAPIPNRGSAQDDIKFLGVHYLQQVSDAVTRGGLHIEPGLWLNIPATTAPAAPTSVVRLGSVPHGDALLAQGQALTVPGPPQICPADSTPTTHSTGLPPAPPYLDPFIDPPLPPGIPAAAVADPNVVLIDAIAGQVITETVVLPISTTNAIGGLTGGIENIPFIVDNAAVTSMSATFWIEKVQDPTTGEFMQLQYTQTIVLNFLGIDWPHITVATLVKQ